MQSRTESSQTVVKIHELMNDRKCFETIRDLRWPTGCFALVALPTNEFSGCKGLHR